jgi:multicomponent Na+:H+ antiporter subunit C
MIDIPNVYYMMAALLFLIGLYPLMFKRNLIKIAIGFMLMENAVNLFLISLGYIRGGTAPILYEEALRAVKIIMVDPLPQALVVTAIVIGLATDAFLLSLAISAYRVHGTIDTSKIRGLRE